MSFRLFVKVPYFLLIFVQFFRYVKSYKSCVKVLWFLSCLDWDYYLSLYLKFLYKDYLLYFSSNLTPELPIKHSVIPTVKIFEISTNLLNCFNNLKPSRNLALILKLLDNSNLMIKIIKTNFRFICLVTMDVL